MVDYEKKYFGSFDAAKTIYNGNDTSFETKEILRCIFPELAESEDERIRNPLYCIVRDRSDIGKLLEANGCSVDEALAWLEKQKELSELVKYIANKRSEIGFYCNHKEVSWNEIPLEDRKHDYPYYFDGDIDCYPFIVEKQKEQKPEQYSPLCNTIKDKIREYIANHFIADTVVKTDMRSIVKAMEEGVRLGKEEQNPAEIDEYEIIKKHITRDSLSSEVNKRLKECGWYVTDEKPAEWSDNLEENIRALLHDKLTWHSEDGSSSSTVLIDDKTLKDIISGIWFYVKQERPKCGNSEKPNDHAEWSEEDKVYLRYALDCVDRAEKSYGDGEDKAACWSARRWLKSLRPKWKPTEEQMDKLNIAIILYEGDFGEVAATPLEDLYEELKKL